MTDKEKLDWILDVLTKKHEEYQKDFKVKMTDYNLGKVGAMQTLISDVYKYLSSPVEKRVSDEESW